MRKSQLATTLFEPMLVILCLSTASAQTQDRPRLVVQATSGDVSVCAYSAGGSTLVTGGKEGQARLWDTATGMELQSYRTAGWIKTLALSADHRSVLSVSGDERYVVQLWDAVTGKELWRIPLASGGTIFAAFSSDGSSVDTISQAETDLHGHKLSPGSALDIQSWSMETGKEIEHTVIQTSGVPGEVAVLSSDGSKLFTGNFDGPLVWDVKTGKVIQRFQSHSDAVETAVFSADGKEVLTGSISGAVRLLDIETGKEIPQFTEVAPGQLAGAVNSVALSADGRRVPDDSNDKMARMWDAATGKELQHFTVGFEGVKCTAFSSDAREVLIGGGNRTARLMEAETGKELRHLAGFADSVGSLMYPAFLANEREIVTASESGTTWLWDMQVGKAAAGPLMPGVRPLVIVSADGQSIFRTTVPGEQAVWDVTAEKEIQRFDQKTIGVVAAAAFASGGHNRLVTTDGATIRVWDLETGKELQHFVAKPGWRPRLLYPEGDMRSAIATLALSPDGMKVLTGDSEGGIRLWDAKTGRQLRSFKVNTLLPLSLAFSPDGHTMITEGAEHSSLLRDVETGKELQCFAAASNPSFSADGRRVLLGGSVWDVESGKMLRQFVPFAGNITGGGLSRDGRLALMGTDDGAAILWNVETGGELARLYGFDDGSWAVVDSVGRFDTGKPQGNAALHWVVGSNPMRVMDLSAYQSTYYTPRLLARILSGESLPAVP